MYRSWLRAPTKYRIALRYIALASIWILFSDQILLAQDFDTQTITSLQSIKGWAFVVFSGLVIFYLLDNEERKQKKVGDLLREKDRTLEAIYGNLPGMVYRCRNDRQWTMEFVSEGCYEITGYRPEDLVGNHVVSYNSLIHPEDRNKVWEGVQHAIEINQAFQLTYRIGSASGEQKWVWEQGIVVDDVGENQTFLEGVIMNITDLRKLESALNVQIERLNALGEIDKAIVSGDETRKIYEALLGKTLEELEVDAVHLMLLDDQGSMLRSIMKTGFFSHAIDYDWIEIGQGHAGKTVTDKQMRIIPNLQERLNEFRRSAAFSGEIFKYYVAVPLIANGEAIGVLELFNRTTISPNQEWFDYVNVLAGQMAIAIHLLDTVEALNTSREEIVNAYEKTLAGWAKAIELKDWETYGHSERVTDLTVKLATAAGVSEEELHTIYMGAQLHDIGKIGIPDSIINKDGPLNEYEWTVMRKHVDYAYDWLSEVGYLQSALSIPRYHHERWDGSGYQEGLKEDDIPLSARIFMIADVWDALTSDRPYRKAWAKSKALDYIKSNAGTLFDPRLVSVFVELARELNLVDEKNK